MTLAVPYGQVEPSEVAHEMIPEAPSADLGGSNGGRAAAGEAAEAEVTIDHAAEVEGREQLQTVWKPKKSHPRLHPHPHPRQRLKLCRIGYRTFFQEVAHLGSPHCQPQRLL